MTQGQDIVLPTTRQIAENAFKYLLGRISVIPTYIDVFGKRTKSVDLHAIVADYPVVEWLSFLARSQTLLGSHRTNDHEYRKRVFYGMLGPGVRLAIDKYCVRAAKQGIRVVLFYERQLSTLQQYAILHAPETGEGKLETDQGKDDLGRALLMIAELMMRRPGDLNEFGHNLECRIQDQIRMSLLPPASYAGRAFYFYQLNAVDPPGEVRQYLSLFEDATGVVPRDFILGGLTIAAHEEIRLMRDEYEGWSAIPDPDKSQNPREAECVRAYLSLRCKPVTEIRKLIERFDAQRQVQDWNLIALSMLPLVDLGSTGSFVLNLTALGRSLFDGVRHTILTAALRRELPDPWNHPAAIGNLYGNIFERFVQGVLETAFPGRVHRIPHGASERADFVIPFGHAVVVLEVKGEHFIGLDHASFISLEDRRRELEDVGLPKAISQIASTIGALRSGAIDVLGPNVDWTITPVVPVIVTEERPPQVAKCWDELYETFMQPLKDLEGAGPIARFRLIPIDDLEILPDITLADDFGTTCLKWANEPDLSDSMLSAYLSAKGYDWRNGLMIDRYVEVMHFLAGRLGLDAEKLRPEVLKARYAGQDEDRQDS